MRWCVVWEYRLLGGSLDYAEVTRKQYRWRWLARLLNAPALIMKIDGRLAFCRSRIEANPA